MDECINSVDIISLINFFYLLPNSSNDQIYFLLTLISSFFIDILSIVLSEFDRFQTITTVVISLEDAQNIICTISTTDLVERLQPTRLVGRL